jgi:hypothetical protein
MFDRKSAMPAAVLPGESQILVTAASRRRHAIQGFFNSAAFDFAIPTAIYTFCFFVLTYPLIWVWSTNFYCDRGDGLQNEWNLWWIKKALVQLHQSPWFTDWLHAPQGTTLIGHTLNPLNGLIGIPLSLIFSRVQVYNFIVTGSFVFSGVTAFWLARHVARLYVPALFGGFAFTFTGYHFAHAYGHMQLISMQFIPLFLLAWLRMLEQPRFGRAVAGGCALGLVAFCDFYYVFYCVMAGALCGAFYVSHLRRIVRLHRRSLWHLGVRFGLFVVVALIWCGPFLILLLVKNARDPFDGAHDAVVFSADAFSAWIPGGANMLGRFTKSYWSRLTGDLPDQCVYVGISVLTMAVYGAIKNRARHVPVACWSTLALCAYVLSLGPVLHIHGIAETGSVLPYAWLTDFVPPLKLSGCPARMTVMLALALSMLLSLGVSSIWQRRNRSAWIIPSLFAAAMAIDLSPIRLPNTPAFYPAWTAVLRNLPLKGAVISQVDDRCLELYYQTLYDRPMAFGYISRVPASVLRRDRRIALLGRIHDFSALRALGFVYLVLPRTTPEAGLPIVYSGDQVVIQQLPDPPARMR